MTDRVSRLGLLAAVALCGAVACAQDEAGDPLPTLDELLGVEGGATESDDPDALPGEGADAELDRLLSGAEIADEFRSAVDLMNRSAVRLVSREDTGVSTQRMQEEALQKLDKLIADAERRSQQSNSSQSSSSQQQSQQQQQNQPDQQRQGQQAGNRENRGEAEPPGAQDGALRPEQLADLAAWGALPERFRDALVQGSSDRFSSTYRRLTEAYYRMLAEERDR